MTSRKELIVTHAESWERMARQARRDGKWMVELQAEAYAAGLREAIAILSSGALRGWCKSASDEEAAGA